MNSCVKQHWHSIIGGLENRAVMEFFQFVQNVSWSQQPYPMYKIFHIAYNFNSKEHTWHLWQREIYCSSIKPWSQVKWPNLGTWIRSIIFTTGLCIHPPRFSYLSYTSHSNRKPFLEDFHVILGIFCMEDLCKDTPTTPAKPAPKFTKNALAKILFSHSSLPAALTPVWCCWCPEWRISVCLLPPQLWQPGSEQTTQVISSQTETSTSNQVFSELLQKYCKTRHGFIPPNSAPAVTELKDATINRQKRGCVLSSPLTPPQFKFNLPSELVRSYVLPTNLPILDSPVQMH